MTDDDGREPAIPETPGTPEKGSAVGVQAVAGALLAVFAVVGVWGLGGFGDSSSHDDGPAECNAPRATDSPEYPALCAALNRPDLPALLGMPDEHVSIAQSGGGGLTTLPDGTKQYDASAQVQIGPVCVRVSHDARVSVADLSYFPGLFAQPATVLGRDATTYSDHAFGFVFEGGKARTAPGGVARHLVVAQDGKADGTGTFEISVWRQDDVKPDAAVLFRIAEKVLPTVPGWAAAS